MIGKFIIHGIYLKQDGREKQRVTYLRILFKCMSEQKVR